MELLESDRRSLAAAILAGAIGREPSADDLARALAKASESKTAAEFARCVSSLASGEMRLQILPADALVAELEALRSSFFWKATGPLRSIATRISPAARNRLRAHLRGLYGVASRAFSRPTEFDAAGSGLTANDPGVPPDINPESKNFIDVDRAANAARWCTGSVPDVSIVIVARKADLTTRCLAHIWSNTANVEYEIVIVYNEAEHEQTLSLSRTGPGVRVYEIGPRCLGEARNIAVERANGEYICFLDESALVQPGWLSGLLGELKYTPHIGAVGPSLLSKDGAVIECGQTIDAEGHRHPTGTSARAIDRTNQHRSVDCVSAKAMLVKRAVFMALKGFDLAYEPEGYEDADFCFKLQGADLDVRACPDAAVILPEADPPKPDALKSNAMIDIGRATFLARWRAHLTGRSAAPRQLDATLANRDAHARPAEPTQRPKRRAIAIYTPFDLRPGGGERYVLTLAAALSRQHRVSIVTPHQFSRLRVDALGDEFGVDVSRCEITSLKALAARTPPDDMVVLGNHIVPPTVGLATNNWYACQFPFPMATVDVAQARDRITRYHRVLVYSDYAKQHVSRALATNGLSPLPIDILHPPVRLVSGTAEFKKPMILSVGRFFAGAHNKRHDAMIEAFRDVAAKHAGDIELHLAGSSIPDADHADYLAGIMQQAADLPITIHVNPTTDELNRLYGMAALYWHATGLGTDLESAPEKAEHFGISVVEAMSAEAVPLAFAAGGPAEIISHGADGYLYKSQDELVDLTLGLMGAAANPLRVKLGRAASKSAARYSVDRFADRVLQLFASTSDHPRPGVAE